MTCASMPPQVKMPSSASWHSIKKSILQWLWANHLINSSRRQKPLPILCFSVFKRWHSILFMSQQLGSEVERQGKQANYTQKSCPGLTLQSRGLLYQLSNQGNSAGRGSNLQHHTKAHLKPLCLWRTVYSHSVYMYSGMQSSQIFQEFQGSLKPLSGSLFQLCSYFQSYSMAGIKHLTSY